ncbi:MULTISPECIES: VOC family protein [Mesorhizobium]|nr:MULTISPECIES: VOC family protein [Mesorhizobium]
MSTAYSLDHLVLPVANLDEAQRRYRALGFTVAPVGVHPFGTANCCVYLEDGTFLEPLAVADADAAAQAVDEGNGFVTGDRIFRDRAGDEGFSAIVLGTADAKADDKRFVDAGISSGKILDFSRDVIDKTGKTGTAAFRLAFARDLQSPAPYFFTCQRVKTPKVDRAALQHHRNRVSGLRRIVLASPEPRTHSAFLETFFDAPIGGTNDGGGLLLKLLNVAVEIVTPQSFARDWGLDEHSHDSAEGLHPVAVLFSAPDIEALTSLFKADGITYVAHDNALVVPPTTGQGAHFIFEASA